MYNVLISAKNLNFDVFNALNVLDNKEFIDDLKFGRGDGLLWYYIYNEVHFNADKQGRPVLM